MTATALDTRRTGPADRLLSVARTVQADLNALEARRFEIATDWAALHPGDEVDPAQAWEEGATSRSPDPALRPWRSSRSPSSPPPSA